MTDIWKKRLKIGVKEALLLLAMVILGYLLISAGNIAHAQTVLYVGGSHTGETYQPTYIKHGWAPTTNGVLDSINIYTKESNNSYAGTDTYLTVVDDSTGLTIATSNQNTYRGYDTGLQSETYTFAGANRINLSASKTYTTYLFTFTLAYAYAVSVGNDVNGGAYDLTSEYMAVYGASPTLAIVSPTSNFATSTTPTFHFQATVLQPSSFQINALYEQVGASSTPLRSIYDTNLGGISVASSGTYDVYGLLNGISDTGDYTNFTFNLVDNSGNILAQATSSVVISFLASSPSDSFGQFIYYTGSSTQFYLSHIPNILMDNATPSDFYTSITSVVDKLLNSVYGITSSFSQYFSQSNSITLGNNVKSAFLSIFGYINAFDSYADGYPIAETIVVFLVLEMALFVIKAIRVLFMR